MNDRNFWILESCNWPDRVYRWVHTWESDEPLPFRRARDQAVEWHGEFDDDTRLRPATSDEARIIYSWSHPDAKR